MERILYAALRQKGVAGWSCVLILAAFAVAGWWPFRQIPNDVTWLAGENGVRFGAHGVIVSSGVLSPNDSGRCSVQMWVRPAAGEDSGTLLAFYSPTGGVGVSVQRSQTDLRLDRQVGGGRPTKSYVSEALQDGHRVFVTWVMSAGGTALYLSGMLARRLPQLVAGPADCTGAFGVGHPVIGHSSWRGDILGLAIYRSELAPDEVLANYRSWVALGRPDLAAGGSPAGLYLFDEKAGGVVHDHGTSGVNLIIPSQYRNIRRTLLQSPFEAFEAQWGYLEDLLINVGGFIPFGFALRALMSLRTGFRRLGLWTTAGGLVVSLSIEILQAYLPTRNSDVTDVITNTLGTCLGSMLHSLWQRRLLMV